MSRKAVYMLRRRFLYISFICTKYCPILCQIYVGKVRKYHNILENRTCRKFHFMVQCYCMPRHFKNHIQLESSITNYKCKTDQNNRMFTINSLQLSYSQVGMACKEQESAFFLCMHRNKKYFHCIRGTVIKVLS